MNESDVTAALLDLPLGGLRFLTSTGSTNDDALAWAAAGAQDFSIVVADEQTAGRGRSGRKWFTPPGSALAISVVLRPTSVERTQPGRITGLGALAMLQSCTQLGLHAQIKWPNDVLVGGKKVAGILVEAEWAGNRLAASVLGIGVNVGQAAIPPATETAFPATSLATESGRQFQQVAVLKDIVTALLAWRSRLGSPDFIRIWEDNLAFRQQVVSIGREGEPQLTGKLDGLEPDGSLRLVANDMPTIVHFGEIHLRRRDDRIG